MKMNLSKIRNVSIPYILLRILLLVYAFIVIYPITWSILESLKTNNEFFNNIWGLPTVWAFENYVRAWTTAKIGSYFINSVIVTVISNAAIILICAPTTYILARFRFRGSFLIRTLFVSGMLLPQLTVLLSQYLLLSKFHLINTYTGLILVYIVVSMPFTIFMLVGFFKTIPKELEESAKMDGCGYNRTFWSIMFPMAKSGLIMVTIFNVLAVWNEYAIALTLISDDKKKTIAVGLTNLFATQQHYTDWSALFAGLNILMIPSIIIYVLFQKRITQGITLGAIK
jgi:N-acetylglucosamine transport system permease protein